jgi:fucose permease
VNVRRVAALAAVYLAFAMPVAMLGVAWPEIREVLGRGSGELGILAGGYGLGRLSAAPSSGPLLRRLSFGHAMLASTAVLAALTAWVATGPIWPVLVVAVAGVGVASGALESLGSRFMAVSASTRSAGVLAGSYGVGATIGPALVVVLDGRWQLAYGLSALVTLAAGVMFLGPKAPARVSRDAKFLAPSLRWPDALSAVQTSGPATQTPVSSHGSRTAVMVSLSLFAVFVGIEVTAGQWTATFLEQARDLDRQLAGVAASGFWAGLTLGRMLMGAVAVARRALLVLAALLVPALVAVAVGPRSLAPVFVVAAGVLLAPMFPALMAATRERVGAARAGQVSGWQLLAGNAGATGFPALTGLAVSLTSPAAPAVILALMSVAGLLLLIPAARSRMPATVEG